MRRIFSRKFSIHIFLALILTLTAYGQSLGDIARENRDKKAADEASPTPPKVITNATIGKAADPGTNGDAEASAPQTMPAPAQPNVKTPQQRWAERQAERRAAQQRAREQQAAQQWKSRIQAQKYTVANLQVRVDRLKGSIHFVDQNAYDSNNYSAVMLDRYQGPQLEHLKVLQQQLDQQKAVLETMQEAARRAGMHTRTYDP